MKKIFSLTILNIDTNRESTRPCFPLALRQQSSIDISIGLFTQRNKLPHYCIFISRNTIDFVDPTNLSITQRSAIDASTSQINVLIAINSFTFSMLYELKLNIYYTNIAVSWNVKR